MSKSAKANISPMLNAYPDSIGGRLSELTDMLASKEMNGAFGSMYILPSLYNTDLDRGFSVIDYDINGEIATESDLARLRKMGINLKLDFILNHLSVNSPQFQDLMAQGADSDYKDFFIDWNDFWKDKGEMTPEGYIRPDQEFIKDMFFRKPGLPILMVPFPDGREVPYWNTFYQQVTAGEDGCCSILGQMDLDVRSKLVWDHYKETLEKLASYGADIIRLDAFAYTHKEAGRRNFFNEPETWDILNRIQNTADRYGLALLPEIHAAYEEGLYKKMASRGYLIYDFFLPGLILDAFESKSADQLAAWAKEIIDSDLHTVNMLGCHDGIPVLDLKGLLSDERIEELIEILKSRGGHVKDLHGQSNIYYQVNAAYLSALGGDEDALVLARAVQMFMPGKPQVWYLDLLAGTNDYEAVKRAGAGGHKEINRTNLSRQQANVALEKESVKKQIELIKFRNNNPVFSSKADIEVSAEGSVLKIKWSHDEKEATLHADFSDMSYSIY